MQQDHTTSLKTRRLSEHTSLHQTQVAPASRQRLSWDDFYGLVEGPLQVSGSSNHAPSSVCPFCIGQASTSAGECTSCMDPQELCVLALGMSASSAQTGSLPAFGEVITDVGAPQSELDSRRSSPLGLPASKFYIADDNETSQRGDTVAPTTDGEENDGGWETDAGTEEIFYAIDPTLIFPAMVRLPEAGCGECQGGNNNEGNNPQDDSDHQNGGTDGDEEQEEGKADEENGEEEQEGATADSAGTSGGFSSFRHPAAPTHNWVAADIVLQMIVRGTDANGRATPAAKTDAMMKLFPRAQRMTQLSNERWKCRAMARIDLETMDWEEFSCDRRTTYKNKNDLRRHFTEKHLGDKRAEKRCGANAKRKLDDEEDPQVDLPATKRARRK